jgi:ABC-type phosphate/phosphonate transport system substrate-binding protein
MTEPNFDDPKSMMQFFAEESISNYGTMKRNKTRADVRQRVLNSLMDVWQRARKSINDSELLDELQARLEELEKERGLRKVK